MGKNVPGRETLKDKSPGMGIWWLMDRQGAGAAEADCTGKVVGVRSEPREPDHVRPCRVLLALTLSEVEPWPGFEQRSGMIRLTKT